MLATCNVNNSGTFKNTSSLPGLRLWTPGNTVAAQSSKLLAYGHRPGRCSELELGRYRFFKSVSVFVFLVGFSKVGIGFGFSKYRDIGFGFFARTYHCLSDSTIADTLRPPLSPNGVWALEFAIKIAAIRDSDIVTIDNL